MAAVDKGRWFKLPDIITAQKAQVSLNVSPGQRTNTGAYIKASIEFSHDGVAPATDLPSYQFEWFGNNKTTKAGWPDTGPAVRIETTKIIDENGTRQSWVNGLYVRFVSDSSVPFTIDVSEFD